MMLFMLGALMIIIRFYRIKERKLINRLQNMIDRATDGTYDISDIDESTLSALENSMYRYLSNSLVSSKNLLVHKETIQTLISDISHQSITPISNILLYAQLLEEKDSERVNQEEIIAIKEQTEKLSFLINSLVKMSRLEMGIIAVETKLNKIQELLNTVVRNSKVKAIEKNIMIQIVPSEEVAIFDLKWTVEAIYNIVDNAVKYTPNGGRITIQSVSYNLFCRIDITDTGIGIAEKEYSKIFRRFYRSKAVSDEDGVGIGLFLARQIISLQGGYIKVSSKEGEGSKFSVFLPLQKVSEL